jgi:hypothetical protein
MALFRRSPPPREPGPSPVAWISDEVWRVWNRSSRDPAAEECPIFDPIVTVVSERDLGRVPRLPVEAGAPGAPVGSVADHRRHLASTRSSGFIGSVRWPVCCRRLTTLVFNTGKGASFRELESRAGSLDGSLLEAFTGDTRDPPEQVFRDWAALLRDMRAGRHAGDGVNFFHCRSCGRVYGSYSEA